MIVPESIRRKVTPRELDELFIEWRGDQYDQETLEQFVSLHTALNELLGRPTIGVWSRIDALLHNWQRGMEQRNYRFTNRSESPSSIYVEFQGVNHYSLLVMLGFNGNLIVHFNRIEPMHLGASA